VFEHKPITTSFSFFAFTTLALAACDPGPEEPSVLDRVGAQVELLDVSALELPETTMSPEAARELASYKPLVDAAMQLGVPSSSTSTARSCSRS
jgi:hypothetical protein